MVSEKAWCRREGKEVQDTVSKQVEKCQGGRQCANHFLNCESHYRHLNHEDIRKVAEKTLLSKPFINKVTYNKLSCHPHLFLLINKMIGRAI